MCGTCMYVRSVLLLHNNRANMTGLFVWLNPTGMPNQPWVRYSLSYAHNQAWRGPSSYLFDDRINASNEFETQAYTSLMQVSA